MDVLVFGASGQLGEALRKVQPEQLSTVYLQRDECDLGSAEQVRDCLEHHEPRFVVNAAAYTAVDKAESEATLARAINADAPAVMAEWVKSSGFDVGRDSSASSRRAESSLMPEQTARVQQRNLNPRLIHISTDFVFDGAKTEPYLPDDPPHPKSVYGQSKLDGEKHVAGIAPEQSVILRTSWVYSEHGNNFVKTMLRLMQERDELNVVDDQRGSPTYARGLAETIWEIVCAEDFAPGIYHWTDAGVISWFEFALAIQEEALDCGILAKKVPVRPISTEAYPTPAARPYYSALDSSTLEQHYQTQKKPWRDQLRDMLRHLIVATENGAE